jgi:hypothetical protein
MNQSTATSLLHVLMAKSLGAGSSSDSCEARLTLLELANKNIIVGIVVRSRQQLYRTHALSGTIDLRNWSNLDRPMIGKFGSGSEHTTSPLYQIIST